MRSMGGMIAFMLASVLSACSVPSLQPVYTPDSLVQDSGLIGEWATDGPTVTRVAMSEGPDGRYAGALTIHEKSDLKTGLALEIAITQIGNDRYADLYLAKPERESLAGHYGFLALPVHQFMMIRRDGDTIQAWFFDADWFRRAGSENTIACEVLPIAGNDIAVVTAKTVFTRDFLRRHAHDPGALTPPIVFHRVARVQGGSPGAAPPTSGK